MPPGYRLEYASTARAGCNGRKPCKGTKIGKGELRFGTWVEIPNANASFKWRHWGCVTDKVLGNVKTLFEGVANDIDGYEDLNETDQAKVAEALAVGHVAEEDIPESAKKCSEDVEEGEGGEESEAKKTPKKRKRASKKEEDAEEDGLEADDKPKKKAPAKKRSKKKAASEEDNAEPEEEDTKPKRAKLTAHRASARNSGKAKKSMKEDSDGSLTPLEDDGDGEDEKPKVKATLPKRSGKKKEAANGKAKKRPTPKSKETISSDDEEARPGSDDEKPKKKAATRKPATKSKAKGKKAPVDDAESDA